MVFGGVWRGFAGFDFEWPLTAPAQKNWARELPLEGRESQETFGEGMPPLLGSEGRLRAEGLPGQNPTSPTLPYFYVPLALSIFQGLERDCLIQQVIEINDTRRSGQIIALFDSSSWY